MDCFSRYSSHLSAEMLGRVVEQAKKENPACLVYLLLWLGLRSGASVRDLLRLKVGEVWTGIVPVWLIHQERWECVQTCTGFEELAEVRDMLRGRNQDEFLLEWGSKRTIDAWIRSACKRAGVSGKIAGYDSVVCGREERERKQLTDKLNKMAEEPI